MNLETVFRHAREQGAFSTMSLRGIHSAYFSTPEKAQKFYEFLMLNNLDMSFPYESTNWGCWVVLIHDDYITR